MIGRRLKDARKAVGMTQAQLAKSVGIDEFTVSRISHYETDLHSPGFDQACRFAEILDVPDCYLYCRDDALAAHLLAIHKRHKKFRFNPAEVRDLEVAEEQLKAAASTVSALLKHRKELENSEEFPDFDY